MRKILIILIATLFIGCADATDNIDKANTSQVITNNIIEGVTGEYQPVIEEPIAVEAEAPVKKKRVPNVWLGSDHGLPPGTVVRRDCANCNTQNPKAVKDLRDNYITILRADGIRTITRDIDVDSYLNIRIGDIIK